MKQAEAPNTSSVEERGDKAPLLRLGGTGRVWVLNLVTAAAALALFLLYVRDIPALDGPIHLPWWALAGVFALTEIHVVHLQFRRDAHSFSLSEIALVLGLFFTSPTELVVAQFVGAAVALIFYRRQSPLKTAFNISHFCLEACAAVLIFQTVVAVGDPTGAMGWLGAFLATMLTSATGVIMIAVAISLSEGRLQLQSVRHGVGFAFVVTITNTSLALVGVSILWLNWQAAWLLLIPTLTLFLAYRAYSSVRQKHESLEFLYESTRTVHESTQTESAMVALLEQARKMFRAEMAEITLFPASRGEAALRTTVGPGDEVHVMRPTRLDEQHKIWSSLANGGDALLFQRPADDDPLRHQLASKEIRNAMLAPLHGETRVVGSMLVANRLGEVSTFDFEDLKLFETLANHASVSLEVGRLEKTLAELTKLQSQLRQQAGALRESEERFKGAFRHTVTGMAITQTDGRFLEVNGSLCRMLGYSEQELLDKGLMDVTHPEDLAQMQGVVERLLAGTIDFSHISPRYIDKVGHVLWVELAISLVRDADGTPLHFVIQVHDMTESKREAEARARLAAIVEATTDLVGTIDAEGRRLYMNKSGRRILGYGEDEDLTHTTIYDNRPQWARDVIEREGLPKAREHGVWSGETAFIDASGKEIPISQVILAHKDPSGHVEFFSTIARDTSERRHLEEQLRQSQKMDAIGQLAGGVAHDFNNLLFVIQNCARFLAEDIDQENPMRQDVDEIQRASERAAALVRQLLTFSRKEIVDPQILDMRDVVKDMEGLLRRTIGEDVELSINLSEDLWKTKVDPGQMQQVLANLAVNARDAMPTGGNLLIETYNVRVNEEFAKTLTGLSPGDYVCLSVTDTGSGMPPEVVERVFEPFYTTKPRGAGTGLGLATVYGIINQANGCIAVESDLGAGSTFRVYLPATASETRSNQPEPAGVSGEGRGETILVAEDEDGVRELVRRILSSKGYRVLTAPSGVDALHLSKGHDGRIDLLLTDVIMPGMSGKELATTLKDLRAGLKIIYMSGYTDQIIAQHGVLGEQEELIQKPFSADDLLAKVRHTLDAPSIRQGARVEDPSATSAGETDLEVVRPL